MTKAGLNIKKQVCSYLNRKLTRDRLVITYTVTWMGLVAGLFDIQFDTSLIFMGYFVEDSIAPGGSSSSVKCFYQLRTLGEEIILFKMNDFLCMGSDHFELRYFSCWD